jgi:hypothetical protein
MEWAAFERVNGSILIHERIDWAGAVLAYVTAASHGAKITLRKVFSDYFEWDRTPVREEDSSAALGMILEAAASQPLPHSS